MVGNGVSGALEKARELRKEMPVAVDKKYGHLEGYEWWEENAELFEQARKEWGPRCSNIYAALASPPEYRRWLCPPVVSALEKHSIEPLRKELREVASDGMHGVFSFPLFTEEFCDLLLDELDHLEQSGIPMRRPNGMNRFGAILSQLGFQDGLLIPMMNLLVAPLAAALWPQWAGDKVHDCDEAYGFVVRYRLGEDVDLAEHADTSNVTLNACLGREFSGGDIYFKGVRFTDTDNDTEQRYVSHRRGTALIHLGGHFHGVNAIKSGERSNFILWCTGRGGVVRIRPDSSPPPPKQGCVQG
eukprot:gnl/MRDRNA2_/MRDRNA2_31801_c0_seq1.p1 gnl/MRDRNA2_/MRDRNA2_31801_c0~~gnl/MRDRNA2_/MRDRNA2_31801_c0_seq1.p1  ORF type:complete len:301 (+),score=58.09 gnl/MRDRNA2_/MRDRNA2_31801_c0_seq1:84-986(+)